ncbi:MAG: FAD-dependent oxidoreductase [Clostridiales bacterium]|jgi:NAD(P)H-nitrite reductase large subunit|nr:FAD-dependent oxidoreductase [Clostridiales bacterium]
MSKYVIIGNSAAAVGCVEGIRSVDKTGKITLITNEPHHTYSRPLISYLLLGKTDRERMKYRPDDFYEKNNCDILFGKTAVAVSAAAKKILLDDDNTVQFEKLLVATGSVPFVPPMEGLDSVNKKCSFMSLSDAEKLQSFINKDSEVLIIGAGLIGLKCAEGILNSVKKITVVDLADRILASILDKEGAAKVQKHLEEKGVSFILGDSAAKFTENSALLKSGKEVPFDALVLAVGVRPNISLIKDADGDIRKGIVTDDHCKTSLDNIYAAGDCSESFDITSAESKVLALLPNAYSQGFVAGKNMAGEETLYISAMPMNAIGFFGLHMITAGSYVGEVIDASDNETYKKFFVKDGCLKGYIIIGDVSRAGIYTSLIKEQVPLDTIDFELIKRKPQLMAFAKTERDLRVNKAFL